MNLQPILQKLYPAGSVGPGSGIYQGECISFLHVLAEFGRMGDSYKEKKKFIELNGIIAANIAEVGKGFRIGDIVVTSDGTFLGYGAGHGCMVINQDAQNIYVAESNFSVKKRISYGRKIAKNDKKIYGILRCPLKIAVGDKIHLKVSYLMNNFFRPWDSAIFKTIADWFLAHTNIVIDSYPVRTSCSNWWYEYSPYPDGTLGKSMAKQYFDDTVLPLQFPYSNVIALVVRPDEWEGSILGKQNVLELAWYFPNSNPAHMVIAAYEDSLSPWYNMPLLQHAIIHEIAHHLNFVNGLDDTTHRIDNQNHQLQQLFDGLDVSRINANL